MSKGFTLFEVLVAIVVIGLALLGILYANTAIQRASDAAYERMVAMQDTHRVIEDMRSAASSGTFPTNVMASFPNGGVISGFNNLPGEQVTVTYTNPEADPLDVIVTTSWLEQGVRSTSVQLRTLLTERE